MKSYKSSHLQKKIAVRKKAIKRQRFVHSRIFFDIVLAMTFVLLLVYFLFFSQIFKITNIYIDSIAEVPEENLNQIVAAQKERTFLLFIKRDSFFLLDSNTIAKRILLDFPKASKVQVKKGLFSSLYITVQGRIAQTVWFFGTSTLTVPFLADQQGIIFSRINQADITPDLIVVYSEMPQKDVFGQVASQEMLDRIRETKKMLEERFGFSKLFFTEKNNGFLYLKTDEGWEVYFDPHNDLSTDLNKLRLLLEQEITLEKRKTLEYIDLRFTKAYYK
ncbi:MAG: cell division protein FtsQ/DivIB [Candidatus Pacebacteria bacterium]|nr:cell division protein FtsQ/DivIB [Candidatus Paceibacterota bacterium]